MSENKPSKSELSTPDKTPLEFEMILDGMDQSEIFRKDEDAASPEEL